MSFLNSLKEYLSLQLLVILSTQNFSSRNNYAKLSSMSIPPEKDRTCNEVLVALRKIIRAVDLHSRQLMTSHNLTTPQLIILRAIESSSRLTTGQIAQKVSLSNPTVTGVLDRLEKRQLVVRERNGNDRRQVWLSCSTEGKKLLNQAPPILQERFVEHFLELEEWKQAEILSSTELLASLMDAQNLDSINLLTSAPLIEETILPPKDQTEINSSSFNVDAIQFPEGIECICLRSIDDLNSFTSLTELAYFLHENMKPYEDDIEAIKRGIDNALNPDSPLKNCVIIAKESNSLIGALVMLNTRMKGYVPENLLLFAGVPPEQRGRGIGTSLVRESIRLTNGNIKLHVEPNNPAKRLYERFGFLAKYDEMRLER